MCGGCRIVIVWQQTAPFRGALVEGASYHACAIYGGPTAQDPGGPSAGARTKRPVSAVAATIHAIVTYKCHGQVNDATLPDRKARGRGQSYCGRARRWSATSFASAA